MHIMLVLQVWMMSDQILSYVDHTGILSNNDCSLEGEVI